MQIDVLGSGSAFSTRHNTSSIRVMDGVGNQWLIDCGPTIPRALWQRDMALNDIDVIYFTHVHPDHCSGLVALLNRWKSFGRSKPITIYCQPEQRIILMQLAQMAIWPETQMCFDIHWHEIYDQFTWQHWHIQTAYSQHEISNRAIRIMIGKHSLFYSGDGRPTAETRKLMLDVDIAFQECASFKALETDSSHGDLPDCLSLQKELGLNSLGLYHYFDEAEALIEQAVMTNTNVFVSQDGLFIDLSLPSPPTE